MEIYRVKNLTFTYPEQKKPALNDISLIVKRGEFVTLCGASGCGKTTLLRQLKLSMAPHGLKFGEIYFGATSLEELSLWDQSAKIGFVQQSAENQIVTDKVWHELAFGLESLGLKTPEIRLRVAEMASFFGMQTWFHKNVAELSGGQKQLLNLASVIAMQPQVLILDEPTSQLDPIAASEFLTTISKLNRELGLTVILSEHRLEEALPLSDRVVVMEEGCIIAEGSPREAALQLREYGHGMFLAMPTAMRVWAGVTIQLTINDERSTINDCPVTVRDGSNWLAEQANLIHNNIDQCRGGQWPSVSQCRGGQWPSVSQCRGGQWPSVSQCRGGQCPSASHRGVDLTCAIEWDDVWFKYEKSEPDVVKGLSFKANHGEITSILGGNGVGKTTALSLVARLNKPYRGKIRIEGQEVDSIPKLFDGLLGVLPQNPQTLFVKKTVSEDLLEILTEQKLSLDEKRKCLAHICALCRLNGLLEKHPYDLSDGEQQRAALAKVLLLQPKILLLDEPTKGLDAEFKRVLAGILHKMTAAGAAVVIVSHDVEFCAEHADRCALFFDGNIVSAGAPREFFSGNSFYTTAANRMARELFPQAITVLDVVEQLTVYCGQNRNEDAGNADSALRNEDAGNADSAHRNEDAGNVDPAHRNEDVGNADPALPNEDAGNADPALSRGRMLMVALMVGLLIVTGIFTFVSLPGLSSFIAGGDKAIRAAVNSADSWRYAGVTLVLVLEVTALIFALTWGRNKAVQRSVRHKLSKRTIAAAVMILLAIPLTIYVGTFIFGDRKYYFISLLIILETMIPFALVFESRKPQARELVVIAVLCAIAVAGRAAFFMLPQFKPVVALVIIAGVAFGGEAGFLVGVLTGFVSNFFFGQGPWTPWQMFAFGLIGFLAGVLFRKGFLRRGRVPLAIFGGLVTFVIYGGIMNPAHVLMYQSNPVWEMFLSAYLLGIPFDLVHSAATVAFMLIISQPMLEKLDRIKVKYGLVE